MNKRSDIEVADVFRDCQQQLAQANLCSVQRKAVFDILRCRTMAAGGHLDQCSSCGYQRPAYNSCRNRHCPKCQYIKQVQWVDKLTGRLMPCRYFHIVFTIPEQLNPLFMYNQSPCYDLLFRAAWSALQKAGNNPRFLGAQVGTVAVLHTWGQTLSYHPHIHMIVPAGGLSEDNIEWMHSPKKFFVPVKALSSMFRGILIKSIMHLLKSGTLKIPDSYPDVPTLKQQLYQKRWQVYAKKAFGGMQSVLSYLGRYTHRVAISNQRLVSLKDGKVCFAYRDYRKGNKHGTMTLPVTEFCRRFLQHILPHGYYKIRYFGILAAVNMPTKREQAISLIGKTMLLPQWEGLPAYEIIQSITGKDPLLCPLCKQGRMLRIMALANP